MEPVVSASRPMPPLRAPHIAQIHVVDEDDGAVFCRLNTSMEVALPEKRKASPQPSSAAAHVYARYRDLQAGQSACLFGVTWL